MHGPISPGEANRVTRLLTDIEREISRELRFPVKIEQVSLERGSLISIALISGDASGVLHYLLAFSTIAATTAVAVNQFQQAIVHYPRAKRHFPQLLADFKAKLSAVVDRVIERKKIECIKAEVLTRDEQKVETETTAALEELSSAKTPEEGEKLDES